MIQPPLYTFASLTRPIAPRVLLHYFEGAMDAGHAGALAVEQLLLALQHERLATFDVDGIIDYRARRPVARFESRQFTNVEMPSLVLDLLTDDDGAQLLLLHGSEPDYRWQEVAGAITHLAVSLGASQAISLHGLPLAVPHTRPTFVHQHGSRLDLLPEQPDFFGTVEIPSTFATYMEVRLGEAGLDSRGLAAGIPHYVARDDYPAGASALLAAVADATGLALPLGDLEAAANLNRLEIDAEASQQPEVTAIVNALEAQYDALAPSKDEEGIGELASLLDLPSADEIGARLEAFLETKDPGTQQP